MTNVLGLTSLEPYGSRVHTHDSSAALSDDGKIVGAVAEHRFTRNKHHAGFPWMSYHYLKTLGYDDEDIEAVAIPWPPDKIPRKKLFARRITSPFLVRGNKLSPTVPILSIEKKKIIAIGHQTAQAAAAYRTSGFKRALVVTLGMAGPEDDEKDAGGAIFIGENGELKKLKSLKNSFGLFYSFVTDGLGFGAMNGESFTMGLAPYGDPYKAYKLLAPYAPRVRGMETYQPKKPVRVGFAVLNTYQRFVFSNQGAIPRMVRIHSDKDVAAAAQRILEEGVTQLIDNALEQTGLDRVCLAGGVFLNVKLNKAIRELRRVKKLYIYPNPSAGGSAVGAALEAHHRLTGEPNYRADKSIYLGPDFTDLEIEAVLKKLKVRYAKSSDPSGDAAELISRGNIVGWFQGRSEWGPRSLGNRSILASPHDRHLKEKLNMSLKQRDTYFPFAPSILLEQSADFLKNPAESPYMLLAFDVLPHKKHEIAATVHIDNTVRPQTVSAADNSLFYDLIREHDKMSGIPAVLNTSFRRSGTPIISTPEDAVLTLKQKWIDALVIGSYVVKAR